MPVTNLNTAIPGVPGTAAATTRPTSEELQRVLERLREVKIFEPRRRPGGVPYYEELDRLGLGDRALPILRHLVEQGYATPTVVDTVLHCPHCVVESKSPNLAVVPTCPKCNSHSLAKDRLLEHRTGGHIHPEALYRQADGRLVCPTCSKELASKADYRVLGSWYSCRGCNAKHERLPLGLVCLTHNLDIPFDDADLIPLFKYAATPKVDEFFAVSKATLVQLIQQVLTPDARVEASHTVQGKSGVAHQFDLAILLSSQPLFVDLAVAEEEADESVIIRGFAKAFDVGARDYLLIGWPRFSEKARSLARLYKLNFIEAATEQDLRSKLQPLLSPAQT